MFTASPETSDEIPADLATLIRIGTVLSVDLAEARCIVRYGDPDGEDEAETPPIRWLAARAGCCRRGRHICVRALRGCGPAARLA